MENRMKQLEIEVTYLKRELDSLKMILIGRKPNINNTTNNMTYNVNQIPEFMDCPDERNDNDFFQGVNLN